MAQVLAFKQKENPRREIRMAGGHDHLVNNTSKPIILEDVSGRTIETLQPGAVFQPDASGTVYFAVDPGLKFCSYVNEESPDEFTY